MGYHERVSECFEISPFVKIVSKSQLLMWCCAFGLRCDYDVLYFSLKVRLHNCKKLAHNNWCLHKHFDAQTKIKLIANVVIIDVKHDLYRWDMIMSSDASHHLTAIKQGESTSLIIKHFTNGFDIDDVNNFSHYAHYYVHHLYQNQLWNVWHLMAIIDFFLNVAFKTDCIQNKCMLQCTHDVIAVLNAAFTKGESISANVKHFYN